MLKKISALGLLGFAVMGAVALPVKADTAVVQQGTQDLVIDGAGNTAIQSSRQENHIMRQGRHRRPTDSTGVVQDIYQGTSVYGRDNAALQESEQVNVVRERQQMRNRGAAHGRHRSRVTIDQD